MKTAKRYRAVYNGLRLKGVDSFALACLVEFFFVLMFFLIAMVTVFFFFLFSELQQLMMPFLPVFFFFHKNYINGLYSYSTFNVLHMVYLVLLLVQRERERAS